MAQARPCPYCGNNPVPHRIYWYNETLNILLTGIRQAILYNPASASLARRGWGRKFARVFLALAEALRIISRQKDINRCKVRRAQVLWEEAGKRDVEMQELLLFGKPIDVYIARKKECPTGSQILFSGLPRPAGYSNRWLDLMDDKWLLKKKFLAQGLPVPAGGSACGMRAALKIFSHIQKPAIVKPRAGSRGRHSTTFVFTPAELKSAFHIAQKLCHWVMVEEQLSGPVYRATVVDFKLAGVLRGDPPQIIGDGKRSLKELIGEKNRQPHPGVKDIAADAETERFIHRQISNSKFRISKNSPIFPPAGEAGNLQSSRSPLDYVPPKGERVSLSEKIGVNYGGSSSEDFEICHPENKELFVRAAKVLGDPLVGFDFIIPDITRSYREQRCGFIEANTLPFINLHHDPLLGAPRNVAAKVWDMVKKS